MSISLKAVDTKKTNAMFGDMIKRMNNPQKIMGQVALKAWSDVQDHFKKEEGPGGKWKSLRPATVAARRKGKKKSRGNKILQDTGNLRNRILFRNNGKDAEVVTSVIYAATHNYGRDNIPKRTFLFLSKEAIKSIMTTLQRFIRTGG